MFLHNGKIFVLALQLLGVLHSCCQTIAKRPPVFNRCIFGNLVDLYTKGFCSFLQPFQCQGDRHAFHIDFQRADTGVWRYFLIPHMHLINAVGAVRVIFVAQRNNQVKQRIFIVEKPFLQGIGSEFVCGLRV